MIQELAPGAKPTFFGAMLPGGWPGRSTHMKGILLIAALALSGCGVNIHTNGRCPTPGVSPLASNCPSPEDMKAK